jgi:hypothetical protein
LSFSVKGGEFPAIHSFTFPLQGTIVFGENEVARDQGLEQLLSDDLANVYGLAQKAMFGGWALGIPGVVPMVSRGRNARMSQS